MTITHFDNDDVYEVHTNGISITILRFRAMTNKQEEVVFEELHPRVQADLLRTVQASIAHQKLIDMENQQDQNYGDN